MPAGASNYYLRVKLDEASVIKAEDRLRRLANFAATAAIPTQADRLRTQAPVVDNRGLQQSQRLAAINTRTSNATSTSINQQTARFKELEGALSSSVVAGNRTAGSQLNLARATGEVGIATSKTTREILLGQRSFRDIGTEVALVATKLALWTAAAAAIGATFGIFRKLATDVADVNDALIGLERLTSDAGGGFDRLQAAEGVSDLMRDLNVSAGEASEATFEAAKSYGNLTDALAGARVALLASKVAEIDKAAAVTQLTQVSNAYNLSASEQIIILDKLNEQQNTLGVNVGKTLESTARAAAVTSQAGGTLDQLVARSSVGIRFTGFGPEQVSRAQSRLAQQVLKPSGQTAIIDALSTTSKGKSVLESLLLPGDPTQLKNDVDLIFNTVGERFQEFSGQQKNAIATAFTGGRQGQLSVITGALLENFEKVQRQAAIASNAQGSSVKELDFVLRSVREQAKGVAVEFGRLGANIEQSGVLGIFQSLLALLKNILTVTNDLFGIFNKIPDGIKAPLAGGLGALALTRAAGRAGPVGGLLKGSFSSDNNILAIRRREREAAAQSQSQAKLASSAAAASRAMDRLTSSTAKTVVAQGAQQARSAAGNVILPPGVTGRPIESDVSRARRIGGFVGSPGFSILASLGLSSAGAVFQQQQQPGRTSIFGSALSGAALGAGAGLFTENPLAIGGFAAAGLGAGAISGLAKRQSEIGADAKALQNAIGQYNEASLSLADAANGAAITIEGTKVSQAEVQEAIDRATKRQDELLSSFASGVPEGLIAGKSALDQIALQGDIVGERGRGISPTGKERPTTGAFAFESRLTEQFGQLGPDSGLQSLIENDELIKSIESRFAEINAAESDVKKALSLRQDALKEIVSEFEAVNKADISDLPEKDQIAFRGNELLTSDDPALLKAQLSAIGAANNLISNALNADKDERGDFLKSALLESKSGTLEIVNALIPDPDDVVKLLESDVGADRLEGQERLAKGGAVLDAIRKQIKSGSVGDLTGQALSGEDVDLAIEGAGDALVSTIQQFQLDIATGRKTRARVDKDVAILAANLSRGDLTDPATAQAFVEAQDFIVQQAQALGDILRRQAAAGLIDESAAALGSAQALANALPKLKPGTGAFKEANLLLNESIAALIEQRIQGVKDRFEPLIASAETEVQKASLLGQQANAIRAIQSLDGAALGFTRQQMINVGLVVGSSIDNQRIALADVGLAMIDTARSTLNAAIAYGTAVFNSVVPDFIRSNQLVQSAVSFLGGIRDRIAGLAGQATKGLKGVKKSGEDQAVSDSEELLRQIASGISADSIADSDAATAEANKAAAEAAAQDAAQAAKDLLSARFELLKALARGDDIKVARIALRQAKSEARLASTRAERIRAQAGIVNAEKDLRETVLRERTDQIDFLLQTEQITTQEAIRRLQGLFRFTKGNKEAIRQLRLKIFGLTKQAQNDKTFGLPTEIPLPSILEIKRIIGIGKKVAQVQGAAQGVADRSVRSLGSGAASGAGTTINNTNSITIVVSKDTDLQKVRNELSKATSQTIQRTRFLGTTPGLL